MEPGSSALSWQSSLNLSETGGDLGATLQQAAVLFNFSLHHAVMVLREHERRDAVFDSTTEGALIAAYAVVVATGVASNLLVAGVILSRSRVRTPRNVFLLNLNASDLVLCLVCVPFTLLELLRRHWPLGGALCRLLPFLQCASIFASSASVAIIAIDRQRCVLSTSAERRVQSGGGRDYSRKYRFCRWRKGRRVIRQTLIVWTTACLLSLPNCFSRHAQVAQLSGLAVYTRCVERWPHRYGKQAYTLLVLLAQFLIPVAVLTVAHLRIKAHLGLTSVGNVKTGSATSVQSNADRLRKELARNRRATFILFSVSAVYAISWLPWNALNLAADLAPTLLSPRGLYLSFGVCHLVAMTSATTNPFLYGWLNTNIKKELLEVGERVLSSHRSTLTDTNNQHQRDTLSEGNSHTRRIKSADPSYVTQDSDSNVSRRGAGERYQEDGTETNDQRREKADIETPLRKFSSLKISKREKNLKKLRSFSLEYRGLRERQKLSSKAKSRSIISRETESTSSLTEGVSKSAVSTTPTDLRKFLSEMRRDESGDDLRNESNPIDNSNKVDDNEELSKSVVSLSNSRESIEKSIVQSLSRESITNTRLSITHSKESITNTQLSISHSRESITNTRLSLSNSRESITNTRLSLSNSRESKTNTRLSISHSRESLEKSVVALIKSGESLSKTEESIRTSLEPITDSTLRTDKIDIIKPRTIDFSLPPTMDSETRQLGSRHRYDIVSPLRTFSPGSGNAELWPSSGGSFKTLSLENLEFNQRHLVIHCKRELNSSSTPPSLSPASPEKRNAPSEEEEEGFNRIEMVREAFLIGRNIPTFERTKKPGFDQEANTERFQLPRFFSVRQRDRKTNEKHNRGLSVEANF